MTDYRIREMRPTEYGILDTFLYEAIFQKEGEPKLPGDVVNEPELRIYTENFGEDTDHCIVAEAAGRIVGAAWARILSGDIAGFGHIDSSTPELAMSVLDGFRGRGIGTAMLRELLGLLKEKGYGRASLAVQKENYAVRMYKAAGFSIIDENEQEFIMLCLL